MINLISCGGNNQTTTTTTTIKPPAYSHAHSYSTIVTPPTCIQQGFTAYICTCGDSYVSNFVNAYGHDCDITTIAPTCQSQGYTVYTCKVCGDIQNKDYVNKVDHNYSGNVCQWCGYNPVLESAEYITTKDGWVIAINGENAYVTTYVGDGINMIFPSKYNKISLNFDYFSFDYTTVKSILKQLWICDAYDCEVEEFQFNRYESLEYLRVDRGIIRPSAFADCNNLKTVVIGENVRELGTCCFSSCENLTHIYYFAKNVKCIGTKPYCIFGDAGIETEGIKLEIGDSVINLPEGVFGSHTWYDNHPKIIEIDISSSAKLMKIEEDCFYRCTEITEIFLPNTANYIGINAFKDSGLINIYYVGTIDEWNEINILGSDVTINNCTVFFYSSTKPTNYGNYWYYDEFGSICIWSLED